MTPNTDQWAEAFCECCRERPGGALYWSPTTTFDVLEDQPPRVNPAGNHASLSGDVLKTAFAQWRGKGPR